MINLLPHQKACGILYDKTGKILKKNTRENLTSTTAAAAQMEFHISREVRDKYGVDETLFSITGNVIFVNFRQVRLLADKMNRGLDLVTNPEKTIYASHLNAMGMIDEILHLVTQIYREEQDPKAFSDCSDWLTAQFGAETVHKVLSAFAQEFPSTSAWKKGQSAEDYLNGITAGVSNKEIVLEELLHVWLANMNPAFSPFSELFDDQNLAKNTDYKSVIVSMGEFFKTRPPVGPDNEPLIAFLRAPALANPGSLFGQLQFILSRWTVLLEKHGKHLLRLMRSLDFISEEEKFRGLGPGPAQVIQYDHFYGDEEYERFSQDSDWMPRLVMVAKNTLVWLDQLSRKYERPIDKLHLIPDEELDTLARRGFNGLWLIGLWERSPASRTIKQICGNPEAASSAYSLMNYNIANELGGHESMAILKERCWQKGIRMACDMVPNHTGIDSEWMMNNPDYFLSRSDCPYPNYSFNGMNLSPNPAVGVQIEDHYYDRTDAAVVFKREDYHTGDLRYVYHGNDGTSMPWNDTAQLNYLNPDVREAVMQTIVNVARQFPIIRFDAAMTLAKRHFQRLWFPEPGSGGDIPTRAEVGLTKAEFNKIFPEEFWREVVDRIAVEAPDTLLLAEAFWMMEGYFVRTLGMHRVYNSAFMNMLKSEENDKFRQMIKNTVEFDPDILKRYVNFMSNPDEETAVRQFGKGDKYFGICTLMVTLPGLPMFAHGQIEGLEEKYGMEFRRAYQDETEDKDLIQRHDGEIFPIMHQRYLFSGVRHFRLYDLFGSNGSVNENVIAYSNRAGERSGLVVFNNNYDRASGWIKTSAAFRDKNQADENNLQQAELGSSLNLNPGQDWYVIFRDTITGLEFIRKTHEIHEKGLYLELNGFQYNVYMDFRQVQDALRHSYGQVCNMLNGQGVGSIEEAVKDLILTPIHNAFRSFFNAGAIKLLHRTNCTTARNVSASGKDKIIDGAGQFYKQIVRYLNLDQTENSAVQKFEQDLCVISQLQDEIAKDIKTKITPGSKKVRTALDDLVDGSLFVSAVTFAWLAIREIGLEKDNTEAGDLSDLYRELKLDREISKAWREAGLTGEEIWLAEKLLPVMLRYSSWYRSGKGQSVKNKEMLVDLLKSTDVRSLIGVNTWQEIDYFNREAFRTWCDFMYLTGIFSMHDQGQKIIDGLADLYKCISTLYRAEKTSEYQLDKLLRSLNSTK